MAETEKPTAENLAAISSSKPETSSPIESKADTASAGPPQTPTEATVEVQEKKVKQAFLDRFKRKQKQKADPHADEGTNKTELSAEQTAQAIYKELAQLKGSDYWVFRIRKKTLLLLAGFGIVIMWMAILGGYLVKTYKPEWVFWDIQGETLVEKGPTATPAPEALIRIRIRDNHTDPQVSQAITELLHNKGYQQVETVDDHASEYSGIMIVTKREAIELNQLMNSLLKENYTLSSPSAELTEDSDFQVVILVGNDTNLNQASAAAVID